jgi:X-X-X-Leu-X-X-Gly heptad repeat protein
MGDVGTTPPEGCLDRDGDHENHRVPDHRAPAELAPSHVCGAPLRPSAPTGRSGWCTPAADVMHWTPDPPGADRGAAEMNHRTLWGTLSVAAVGLAGLTGCDNAAEEIEQGADQLQQGADELQQGADELQQGAEQLQQEVEQGAGEVQQELGQDGGQG